MDFKDVVENRRSVRKFSQAPVENEKITECVRLASYSPSWKNTQIARYVVVKDADTKKEIAENGVMGFAFNEKNIKNAPCLIVVAYIKNRCGFERDGSYTTSKEDRWEMYDCGIASQTFCLAAFEQGLGSVIMGIFDEKKISEILNLDDSTGIAALIALGYPDETPVMPKRKDIADLVSFV